MGGYLAEQPLEQGPGKDIPGNRVSDCGEDPVELPHGGLTVGLLARYSVHQLFCEALALQMGPSTETVKRSLHQSSCTLAHARSWLHKYCSMG